MILADFLSAAPDRPWNLAKRGALCRRWAVKKTGRTVAAQLGRLFAVGYMKGILDAHKISYR